MPEFKDMLKYFRIRDRLSQSELAVKLGVSASAISMYEVGKREPDFETEEKIADFFNTDLNTLRGRDIEDDNQTVNENVQFTLENEELIELLKKISPDGKRLITEIAAKMIPDDNGSGKK